MIVIDKMQIRIENMFSSDSLTPIVAIPRAFAIAHTVPVYIKNESYNKNNTHIRLFYTIAHTTHTVLTHIKIFYYSPTPQKGSITHSAKAISLRNINPK